MKKLLLVVALVFASNVMASTGDIEVAKQDCDAKKVIHKPKAKPKDKKIIATPIPVLSIIEPVKEDPCEIINKHFQIIVADTPLHRRITPWGINNTVRPQEPFKFFSSAVSAPVGFFGFTNLNNPLQYVYLNTHSIEYRYLTFPVDTVQNPIPIATPLLSTFWLLVSGLVLFIRKPK